MRNLVIKDVERTWVSIPFKPRHAKNLVRGHSGWTIFEILSLFSTVAGFQSVRGLLRPLIGQKLSSKRSSEGHHSRALAFPDGQTIGFHQLSKVG